MLDHPSVIDLMRTACVVVVPSIVQDCCPTVVLEAMAVGRPVVAAASGGIIDLVDDGVTGLLVPPGDPVALSTALSAVLDDPQRASAMGQAANTRRARHCVRGGEEDRGALHRPGRGATASRLTQSPARPYWRVACRIAGFSRSCFGSRDIERCSGSGRHEMVTRRSSCDCR